MKFFINLPYFYEWMNIIDKKTQESRDDILNGITSPDAIRRYMEQQRRDYDEEFPFKNKFVRKKLWLETGEEHQKELSSEIFPERLEALFETQEPEGSF